MESDPRSGIRPNTWQRGLRAQERAKRLLAGGGLAFVTSNFRWKGGEIDLVFLDRSAATLVFVEVRSRGATDVNFLRYSLGPAKRRRLLSTAQVFLRRHGRFFARVGFRFDVVWVEGESAVEHWKNVDLAHR